MRLNSQRRWLPRRKGTPRSLLANSRRARPATTRRCDALEVAPAQRPNEWRRWPPHPSITPARWALLIPRHCPTVPSSHRPTAQVKLLSNRAECALGMEQWRDAEGFASEALRLDPHHAKSLMRRAKVAAARTPAARAPCPSPRLLHLSPPPSGAHLPARRARAPLEARPGRSGDDRRRRRRRRRGRSQFAPAGQGATQGGAQEGGRRLRRGRQLVRWRGRRIVECGTAGGRASCHRRGRKVRTAAKASDRDRGTARARRRPGPKGWLIFFIRARTLVSPFTRRSRRSEIGLGNFLHDSSLMRSYMYTIH